MALPHLNYNKPQLVCSPCADLCARGAKARPTASAGASAPTTPTDKPLPPSPSAAAAVVAPADLT
eukprot:CAMPEP_0177664334 /NCGR_PEP_ID=MMETSP0447-20121125/20438_1 /TAXON_ID=0 /ORGANISM="Stygamoeba regulata, Strain BSH-02190019" /LENGTH=64 /DNA_ID=CAMNT_0019170299 /DNA_START=566 /DNA_END=756 /DNA_ORIENTATION=+